jgi:NADH dehydrogenase FAD-containing subunit
MTERIVIVGAGFAGMWSALAAARAVASRAVEIARSASSRLGKSVS